MCVCVCVCVSLHLHTLAKIVWVCTFMLLHAAFSNYIAHIFILWFIWIFLYFFLFFSCIKLNCIWLFSISFCVFVFFFLFFQVTLERFFLFNSIFFLPPQYTFAFTWYFFVLLLFFLKFYIVFIFCIFLHGIVKIIKLNVMENKAKGKKRKFFFYNRILKYVL